MRTYNEAYLYTLAVVISYAFPLTSWVSCLTAGLASFGYVFAKRWYAGEAKP